MTITDFAPRTVPAPVDTRALVPVIDVTIPVYNNQYRLEACLRQLHGHLIASFPYGFLITVADNASTDGTVTVAERLVRELPGVSVVRFDETVGGRGGIPQRSGRRVHRCALRGSQQTRRDQSVDGADRIGAG